jgi:polysaccharide pyruvyl transferase WcaK-like protein
LKILIEGAFGEANFGDDLLLLATLQGIRQDIPKAKTLILARDNSVKGDYLDRMPGANKVVRGWKLAFYSYTIKLYAGGTQFYSYPRDAQENHATFAGIAKRIRDKVLRWRHRLKAKAFLGIGIGPFHQGNELACENILRSGKFLAVRDQPSLGYLNQWGIPAQEVGADICFNKEWWLPPGYQFSAIDHSAPVGIVIRDFEYDLPGKAYLNQLLEFINWLVSSGQKVQCFAFSKVKDKLSVERMRSHGFDVLEWQGEMSYLSTYLDALSKCSILITARYHGVVIGSMLGVPSIGVEVDPKVKLACEELGRGAEIWSSPFSVEELRNKYERLRANDQEAREDLSLHTQRLGVRAKSMFNSFLDFTRREV